MKKILIFTSIMIVVIGTVSARQFRNVKITLPYKLVEQDSIQKRLEAMIEKYGKNKGKLIAEGRVWSTISFEMAVDSWGEPLKKQKTELPDKTTEKWIYPGNRYLFFKNGRLESWKD